MGGQATKNVTIPSQYRKYSKKVGNTISSGEISKAAEIVAPYVCMALGHQELAAGIQAFAEAYDVYQRTGDANHAVYCGVATFVAEATPGMIAGAALDAVQSQAGIQINREIAPVVKIAMEDGISRLEKIAFKRAEIKIWPNQTSSNI